MARSMNRLCVVMLVLIASTSFFVDKAQAYGFRSCMNVCDSSYLICAKTIVLVRRLVIIGNSHRLFSTDSINSLHAPGAEKHLKYSYPKHSHSKHSKSVKHRQSKHGHSKHSKHAHH
ncbi:hypothetical protein MKX01_009793 [Papaver californicum]|nr:hypothetical protein MKX01_009793 [Papaver californicum]